LETLIQVKTAAVSTMTTPLMIIFSSSSITYNRRLKFV